MKGGSEKCMVFLLRFLLRLGHVNNKSSDEINGLAHDSRITCHVVQLVAATTAAL